MSAQVSVITKGGAIKLDSIKLEKLMAEVKLLAVHRVKVGVLGAKGGAVNNGARNTQGQLKNPENLTTAEIGLRNEFGFFTTNPYDHKQTWVAERSFLRMPLLTRLPRFLNKTAKADWIKAMIDQGAVKMLGNLGFAAEHVVLEAFATHGFGQWKPNAPLTVKLKGSASPLIDEGNLQQSISSQVT